MNDTALDPTALRDALATFASGVTIITTTDADGTPWGFTASSFCSLSAEPPLILVCLAHSAECHEAFTSSDRFAVSILADGHDSLAMTFATRGAAKFADGGFATIADTPVVEGAVASLACRVHAVHEAGDHDILIGLVEEATATGGPPLLYHERGFRRLASEDS